MVLRLLQTRSTLLFLIALVGLAIGLAITGVFEGIIAAGHRIPQTNMATDYAYALVLAGAIGASILIWPIPQGDRFPLLMLWFVRCLVTLAFMLFYESYYGLDAYWYFSLSGREALDLSGVEIGNGTNNIAALTWLLQKLIPVRSYHSLKVLYSLIGFLGLYIFYRGTVLFLEREEKRFFYLLFLLPSILFWSSILGKDPVNLFGVCLYVYGVLGLIKRKKMGYILPIAAGVLVAATLRIWSGLIMMSPLFIVGIRGMQRKSTQILFIAFFAVGFAAVYGQFAAKFKIENSESVVQKTHQNSRAWGTGGSGQTAPEFKSLGAMVAFAPIGIFTALFRPLPGEILNPFGLLAGMENLFMLWLLVSAVRAGGFGIFRDPVASWATSFVLIWGFLYGFVSYQNMGAAVRFKLQVLPVLLGLLLYLKNKEELDDVRDSGIA